MQSTSHYDDVANLPFSQNHPTAETPKRLRDELLSERAMQTYLWAMPLINTLDMQVGSEKTGFAFLRLGGALLRSGLGLFALGLTTGFGLILHYFYVTPFELCSAALATASVFDVWPWALPLLATEGLALTLAASGLCLISQSRRESAFSHAHS